MRCYGIDRILLVFIYYLTGFRMDFGMGGFSFSMIRWSLVCRDFLKKFVILTIKPKARLRRSVMVVNPIPLQILYQNVLCLCIVE